MYVQRHVRVMVSDQAPGVSEGLQPPPAPCLRQWTRPCRL